DGKIEGNNLKYMPEIICSAKFQELRIPEYPYKSSFLFYFSLEIESYSVTGLECSNTITVQGSLKLLSSSNSHTPASLVAETTGMLFSFFFFLKQWSLLMLPRLVLNSWPQVILLLQPPKTLGLQA
uniref:Uncharacterized protein n=1 Tax=Theropithecus gelada TaxID=9565 RepID=A0A8D2G6J0_THEGE